MKAKVKETVSLTIGMIVKNEQKHIENCLRALAPLREQIPCEVIIADTGSVDQTVELAKKYADEVFHFEWCKDFSAARNAVMERAKGKWFLTLDADEYLDADVSELVRFFRSEESNQYNMGAILIRNYSKSDSQGAYNEFYGMRLLKMSTGIRYVGKIHESWQITAPIKTLDTIIHHYGYSFQSKEEWKKKTARNMMLIEEELKQDPDNLLRLIQAVESSFVTEDSLQYGLRALEVARKNPDNTVAKSAYLKMVDLYVKQKKYDDAAELGTEFFERYPNASIVHIDVCFLLAQSYHFLGKWEETVRAGEQYLELCQKRKSGEMEAVEADLLFSQISFDLPRFYSTAHTFIADGLIRLEKYEEAEAYLSQIDVLSVNVDSFENIVKLAFRLIECDKRYDLLPKYYGIARKLQASSDKDDCEKAGKFFQVFEYYFLSHKDDRSSLAKALTASDFAWKRDELIQLMELELHQEDIDFPEKLSRFFSSVKAWDKLCAQGYYLAVKYEVELPFGAVDIPSERLSMLLDAIAKCCTDYSQCALTYCRKYNSTATIRQVFFEVRLLKSAMLHFDEMDSSDKKQFSELFESCMTILISNVYNPEILNEDDICILPQLHRFGYFLYRARLSENEGNQLEYVQNLRKALEQDRSMKDMINYLMMEVEKQRQKEEERQLEFQSLASEIRSRVTQMVQSGQGEAALGVIKQYLVLQPEDKVMLELKDRLQAGL